MASFGSNVFVSKQLSIDPVLLSRYCSFSPKGNVLCWILREIIHKEWNFLIQKDKDYIIDVLSNIISNPPSYGKALSMAMLENDFIVANKDVMTYIRLHSKYNPFGVVLP